MKEVREWPIPWRDLIVTLEDGREMMAVYTGDGWMFNAPLWPPFDFEQSTVISYRYLEDKDKGE